MSKTTKTPTLETPATDPAANPVAEAVPQGGGSWTRLDDGTLVPANAHTNTNGGDATNNAPMGKE